MCGSLTAHGWLWAVVSILAAGAAGTSFYWADWINGPAVMPQAQNVTFEYGLFRRCNFLEHNATNRAHMILRTDCGRYENFDEIPSIWWRVGTVLDGIGAGLLVLVALTAFFALFLEDVCNNVLAYLAGATQLLAALCLTVTLFIYPLGWDASTLRDEACGVTAGRYKLGRCQLGVAFYIAIGAAVGALLAALFSPLAKRKRGHSDYVI